jgi:hypothetical protein
MARTGLLAFLLLTVTGGLAWAGSISISITPAVELKDGALSAKVKVSNTGDEAAQSILPMLRFRGGEAKGTLKNQLGPNETVEQTLTVPAVGLTDGRYPFRLSVDYTDINQYPFQALQVSTVTVGTPAPAKLAATLQADQLATDGSVVVTLKNLLGDARKVTLTVHASEGIETPKEPTVVDLDGWGTKTATMDVMNRTALAGSRYPLFATAEYDAEGVHQTVVGQSTVEIVPPRSFWADNQQTLFKGIGALVALWIGMLIWRTVGRRATAPTV